MVLLYVLAAVVLINCGYFILFSRFSFSKPSDRVTTIASVGAKANTSENHPVSLIICAKNEAENLSENIPLWQVQEYPKFEIILINDASSDDSLKIMQRFAENDDRITLVDVRNNEAFWGNKKYALTLGIKRASNKRMLFTDADCKPASRMWLKEMTSQFSETKQLILGYGAYEKRKGLLNHIIRFETLMTALQYFSYAKVGMPYMGVGRNLAYTSTLYYQNKGFTSHIKLPSGDDDLFVNEAATKSNTAIRYSENSFTYSLPKKTWKSWILQKRRHVTTSRLYKPKHKMLLGLFFIASLLFWILAIASLLLLDWKLPVAIIVFRFIVQYVVIGKAAQVLKERDLVYLLPFWELFLIIMQMSIFISNSVSKPETWK